MKKLGNETSVKVVSFLIHLQKINLRTQSPSSARPPFRGVAAELVNSCVGLRLYLLIVPSAPHLMGFLLSQGKVLFDDFEGTFRPFRRYFFQSKTGTQKTTTLPFRPNFVIEGQKTLYYDRKLGFCIRS